MKNTNSHPTSEATGAPVALRALALAVFAAFSAHAMANTDTSTGPATLEQTKAAVAAQTAEVDPKAVAERDLRSRAMKEAANSYGARSGLARGNYENQKALAQVTSTYDAVFNFTPFMLVDTQTVEKGGDGRSRLIRPPVVVEARSAYNQLDPMMIRERDAVYHIDSNVRFVPAPPNWRTYLFRDTGEKVAALPHFSLMPKTAEEKARWDGWVSEGWEAGYSQSKAILDSDLARLARDQEGMVLYYELVKQEVLSLPYVATRNDGVTGDADNLNVGDVTLRITKIPAFQRNPSKWVTIATDADPQAIARPVFVQAPRAAAKAQKPVERVEPPPPAAIVAPAAMPTRPVAKPLADADAARAEQAAAARAARMARAEADARASMAVLATSPSLRKPSN